MKNILTLPNILYINLNPVGIMMDHQSPNIEKDNEHNLWYSKEFRLFFPLSQLLWLFLHLRLINAYLISSYDDLSDCGIGI